MGSLSWRQSTCVYLAKDIDENVLYVGMSSQPRCRFKDHMLRAEWRGLCSTFEWTWYENRFDAAEAERIAIREHKPKYNKINNPRFKRDGYRFVEGARV